MWASTNLCLNINYKLEEFKMELNVSNEEYASIFSLLNEDFLLEEYLEKRQAAKRITQEILDKKLQKEEDMREALRKSDAEKAYNNQILPIF